MPGPGKLRNVLFLDAPYSVSVGVSAQDTLKTRATDGRRRAGGEGEKRIVEDGNKPAASSISCTHGNIIRDTAYLHFHSNRCCVLRTVFRDDRPIAKDR